jgi:hypothetical protein
VSEEEALDRVSRRSDDPLPRRTPTGFWDPEEKAEALKQKKKSPADPAELGYKVKEEPKAAPAKADDHHGHHHH